MTGERRVFSWTFAVLVGAFACGAESTSAQSLKEKLDALVDPLKEKADKKSIVPEVNFVPPPPTDQEKRLKGKQKAMEKFDKQIELDALKGLGK